MWLGDAFHEGPESDPARVHALVEAANRMNAGGDTDLALNLLLTAAFRCYRANTGEDLSREVCQAADQLAVSPADPRLIQVRACTAPIERAAAIFGCLADPGAAQDADSLYLLGAAAGQVGDFGQSSSLLGASAVKLREQGRLGVLASVLETRAWAAVFAADFGVAMAAAEEAVRLASEGNQQFWLTAAWTAQAALAALRGEVAVADAAAGQAERAALPAGESCLLAMAQYARGLSALGQGRHADAYDHLRLLSEPGDPACHRLIHYFVIGDLVEAAVRSGHRDHAAEAIQRLGPLAGQTPSPWFRVAVAYARVLLADDEAGFTAALSQDLTSWPFVRARLQLAFGEWLRRQRRAAESRGPLRAARDAFDALGTAPWAERARQELRAAGESSRQRMPRALDQLTPQELQIVQMAAEGLSNREIGQRLYLSRRTVESHLYRVFPKLAVTSRGQLPRVLESG